MGNKREFRLQSAMEYLMTYGWAILIIAIVLGVLYYLGIFNGAASLGTSCIAVAGYYCQNPTMNTAGQLSFTLGQSSGNPQYNIGLSCAATSNSAGLPYTSASANAFYYPATNGLVSTTAFPGYTSALQLTSGQQQAITNLPCFGSTGALLSTSAIGATFTGSLWYNYTATYAAPGGSNPWLTVKMATVTAKTV
jgi:hypothetical protein